MPMNRSKLHILSIIFAFCSVSLVSLSAEESASRGASMESSNISDGETKYRVESLVYIDLASFHFRIFGGMRESSPESISNVILPGAVDQAIALSFLVYLDSVSNTPTIRFGEAEKNRLRISCGSIVKGFDAEQVKVIIFNYLGKGRAQFAKNYLTNYDIKFFERDVAEFFRFANENQIPRDKVRK